MKNQSFHQKKIRIPDTPKLDYDQLKSRTIIALNKLGQQKFSTEPGGYSLENWTRGVNILLDEFEEKMGQGKLSSDYVEKRRELNGRLSNPISTLSFDKSISEIKLDVADIEDRIDAGRARLVSRVTELKSEQNRCSTELVQEQERILSLAANQNPDSFLKRLFAGNSRSSAKDSGTKVNELESRLDVLSNEIREQQKLLRSVDQHSPGSPFAEEWRALESQQTRLEALERERLEKVQLVKEREEIMSSIANTISRIPT
jgi:hypothetical protein